MVYDSRSNSSLATSAARPRHALKDAFLVGLELTKTGAVLDFEPKQVHACTCVFFGVVSALAACLDLAATPFFGEPREARFEWTTAGVMVDERGVDAEGVANPERLEVRFQGVTDEDGGGGTLGCDDGEELCLDFGEGRRGRGKGCFGDA